MGMRVLLRTLGAISLLIGAVTVKVSCTSSNTQVAGSVTVSVGHGGGFAAMDDVPVTGGELRLVMPKVVVFEGAPREAIGFPLEHTAITAQVGGMMAVYQVEQTFANPFDEPIDAVYAFPLGDDGAVSGYEMTIGERTIRGEIRTREEARRVYEQARARGHTAGLLEQQKPNIFTQSVANIAPGERVTIKVTYVELLDYDDGAYESVVPLTIGPRYRPQPSISYVDATRASSTVSFTADIDAGVPIVGITSPSHDLHSTAISPTRTRITLAGADEIPNRDLVVRYLTAGPKTTVGLLAHKTPLAGKDDGYFVLTVQPKGNAHYRPVDISSREVLIVIDRSGSMTGMPIAQAKSVASGILGTLTERDTYNIVGFASGVSAMSPQLLRGDPDGINAGLAYLHAMTTGGGTEMELGVVAMLSNQPTDRVRHVYFITDGFVGNDDSVVGAANRMLGTNRIFTVGVGSSPNRALLDRLARTGRGFASYLTLSESAQDLVNNLVVKSTRPYLTDVTVDWAGLDVRADVETIPDVYMGQPLVISGRYRKPGRATVNVHATTAGKRVAIPVAIELPARSDFEPVAWLWARRQIEALMATRSYADVKAQVTELALQFHLVTEFTSFVAVDSGRIVGDGVSRVVEQPSLLPEEVEMPPARSGRHVPSPSTDDGDSVFSDWGSGGPVPATGVLAAALALLGLAWLVARRAA